jgi:hypothetical protein
MNKKPITPDELYALLPSGEFYYRVTLDRLREYTPGQRHPKPIYDLWEMLSAWSKLSEDRRIISISNSTAKKV